MNSRPDIRSLLVRIAEKDDKNAFTEFFRYYHPKLIRFALMFVDSYQDAEDIVSEVLIKILKQRSKLKTINNFEGYLYLAVKNQSINYTKKLSSNKSENIQDIRDDLLTDSFVQPFELILEDELRTCIQQVVEKLPPQRRLVYKMIKDDGLRCREVAELLDIAEKTVKKHLELAIKDLKIAIEEYYSEKRSTTPVIRISKDLGMALLFLEALQHLVSS